MLGRQMTFGLGALMVLSACGQVPSTTPVAIEDRGGAATESPIAAYQVQRYSSLRLIRLRLFAYRQEASVLAQINAQRSAAGLAPLIRDARLNVAARNHSRDMAAKNYSSHTEPGGSTPPDRLRTAGATFNSWAENIGYQMPVDATGATRMMTWWLGSPGHKANMLNAGYKRIGIGMAQGAGKMHFTTVFAD